MAKFEFINSIKCWWKHNWEFDGGKWVLRDSSVTTRKCKRCGLKQDISHLHLIPNYLPGGLGSGISILEKERRPGDADYEQKFEMNERPK